MCLRTAGSSSTQGAGAARLGNLLQTLSQEESQLPLSCVASPRPLATVGLSEMEGMGPPLSTQTR